MGFLIQTSLARRRSMFCFNQTSEWTTTTRKLHNKPPLARSSQAQRRSGSSKGSPCGLPIKTGSLTVVGLELTHYFSEKDRCLSAVCTVLLVFPLCFVYFLLFMFPFFSAKTAEAGTKGDRTYCTGRVNCCTRIGALTISIFANEGYACTPCTTSFFACL